MGTPAARITDMHVCPMVTPGLPPIPHVGGPIIGPCSPNVITGGMLQARITDQCICVGPPDVIVKGSMTVLVNGLQAARIGDQTAHGGVIVTGFPTVLIGDQGGGGGGAGMGGGESAEGGSLVSSAPGMSAQGGQATTLAKAAAEGAPFCEICAQMAAGAAAAGAMAMAMAASGALPAASTSPEITPEDLTGKTRAEIERLAKDKGLEQDPKKPNKYLDPVTGKERLRIDQGHVDKETKKPYDNPRASRPHVHGYPPGGPRSGKIVDPSTGDPHFPLK